MRYSIEILTTKRKEIQDIIDRMKKIEPVSYEDNHNLVDEKYRLINLVDELSTDIIRLTEFVNK